MFPRTERIKSGVVENLNVLGTLYYQGSPVVPGGGGAVDSVNGYTGVVVLAHTDVGAAAASHSHVIADVTGLQTALDGKSATGHTHVIADTTGLQTALDGKSATSHTHALDDLSDVTITAVATDNVLKWNGSAWVNGTGPATFPDNTFRIYDDATPTKIVAFQLSGLSAATRTITMVNRDITLDTLTTSTNTSGFTTNGIFVNAGSAIDTRSWALLPGTASAPQLQIGDNVGASQAGTGVNDHMYLYRNISGTTADGTGIGIRFLGKSSSTINCDMGVIECVFKTATHASRQTRLDFYVYNVAVKTRMLRLELAGGIIVGTDASDNTVIIPTAGNTNFWIGASGLIKLVDSAGIPNVDINHAGGTLKINGTQVVGARQTGWTAGSGTENKGSINYDTVAFDATGYRSLAQRVLALENAMRSHGLIN